MILQNVLILLGLLNPHYPTIPTAPISQQFGNLEHTGIDFKIPAGTEIFADLDGVIIAEVEDDACYGRYLMIQHLDNYVSLYAHLNSFTVKVGDAVTAGDLIAFSGGDPNDKIDGDGSTTGPHLHWEVRPAGHTDDSKYTVDPMGYLLSFIREDYKTAEVNSYMGLNVRLEPSLSSPILYSLYAKETVQIVEERNGWARLKSVRPEWVMIKWLIKSGKGE